MSRTWTYTKGDKPVVFKPEVVAEDKLKDQFEHFLRTKEQQDNAGLPGFAKDEDQYTCECADCQRGNEPWEHFAKRIMK